MLCKGRSLKGSRCQKALSWGCTGAVLVSGRDPCFPSDTACGRYLQSEESSDGLEAASPTVNAQKMWGQRLTFFFSGPVVLQIAS